MSTSLARHARHGLGTARAWVAADGGAVKKAPYMACLACLAALSTAAPARFFVRDLVYHFSTASLTIHGERKPASTP